MRSGRSPRTSGTDAGISDGRRCGFRIRGSQGETHVVRVLTSTGTPFEHEIRGGRRDAAADARLLRRVHADRPVRRRASRWRSACCGFRSSRAALGARDGLPARADGRAAGVPAGRRRARRASRRRVCCRSRSRARCCSRSRRPGAYLLLEGVGAWLKSRRRALADAGSGGWVLALLIAVGIGLHNFGEGLAIGSAFALGEAALGTLLIIGFTLHNTTEGLAIVAPLARERQRVVDRRPGQARADRRRADDCRRLARRVRLLAGLVGAVSGDRRRRDRAGHRADRPADGERGVRRVPTLARGPGAGGTVGGIRGDVRHGDVGRMSILGRTVSVKVGGGARRP